MGEITKITQLKALSELRAQKAQASLSNVLGRERALQVQLEALIQEETFLPTSAIEAQVVANGRIWRMQKRRAINAALIETRLKIERLKKAAARDVAKDIVLQRLVAQDGLSP